MVGLLGFVALIIGAVVFLGLFFPPIMALLDVALHGAGGVYSRYIHFWADWAERHRDD